MGGADEVVGTKAGDGVAKTSGMDGSADIAAGGALRVIAGVATIETEAGAAAEAVTAGGAAVVAILSFLKVVPSNCSLNSGAILHVMVLDASLSLLVYVKALPAVRVYLTAFWSHVRHTTIDYQGGGLPAIPLWYRDSKDRQT